jgi:hypothetical protein
VTPFFGIQILTNTIEDHILTYNNEAFRAAATSPCDNGVIHNALTFSALSSEVDKLLQGMIPPSWHKNNEVLRSYLASVQIPHTVLDSDPIDASLKVKDVLYGF